jgi:transposase
VALTCRYYGISQQVFYRWLRRYEAEGLAGLRDRSRRPQHCPHETPAEVVGKIIYLRRTYHFGPAKISMYLRRYHDIEISNSGVWRILKRVDLSRLPAYQRYQRHDRKWKRYEKPQPGHAVQVDVKFIAPLASSSKKRYYQFTAIDDCTRVRVLRIYDRLNQKTAIQFADYLLDKLPFRVEAIQTDRVRISDRLPLAPGRSRHPPHLHQARHPAAQREGRAQPPHRRRGVLPPAQRHRHRRHRFVQRQAPRVAGLLQLPSPARRPRRPDTLRTTAAEDNSNDPRVNDLRQLHTQVIRRMRTYTHSRFSS